MSSSSQSNGYTFTDKKEAVSWLETIINKSLRVYTRDCRMFVGTFKCIDPKMNIILSLTHEYRAPTHQKIAEAARAADASETIRAEMQSRYLGLVTIPGHEIEKVELQEFVSQIRNKPILPVC